MHAQVSKPAERTSAKLAGALLSPRDVQRDYAISENTQAVWRCENRHGFRSLVFKVGRSVRYSRLEFEAWLESRRAEVEA